MDFLFPCPKCQATYEIQRRREPLQTPPRCIECGKELPSGDGRDWFGYLRAKPEISDPFEAMRKLGESEP